MPTIRPASITSRKTMTRVASILLRDHDALRRRRMIFAHERIFARRQRTNPHNAVTVPGYDFLDLQRGGIELIRRRILVEEMNREWPVRFHMDHVRREAVVLQRHRNRRVSEGRRGEGESENGGDNANHAGGTLRNCPSALSQLILINKRDGRSQT